MNTIIHALPGQFDIGVRDLKNLSSSKNFGYVPKYEFHKGIKLGMMSQTEFLINKYLKKSIPYNSIRCTDTNEVIIPIN